MDTETKYNELYETMKSLLSSPHPDYDESYDSAESDFLSIVPEDQRVSGDWIPV